ncbi:MAG: TonB C-terminal domain-containing protein [Deltaproteobacteria bacterium]|nr:TonB C-terminal domain-containing protein [Deltaproteobacteria bacterium]
MKTNFKYLFISLLIHTFLFASIYTYEYFTNKSVLLFGRNKDEPSLRIDLVALPKKLAFEKKRIPSKKKTFALNSRKIDQAISHIKNELESGNKKTKWKNMNEGDKEHWYIAQLEYLIHSELELPTYLAYEKDTFATFILKINVHGELKNIDLEKSSGNSEFNEIVKKAIMSIQNFEAPPEDLVGLLQKEGIGIRIYPPH